MMTSGQQVVVPAVTAWQALCQPAQHCTTGCGQLDRLLQGGLQRGCITELTGEAGSAKTQLCLQLLLSVQLPTQQGGLEGTALYIYTEGDPPIRRLQELAELQTGSEELARRATDAIFVERSVTTLDGLLTYLLRLEDSLLRRPAGPPVRLLIIDSVTNLCRDIGDEAGVASYAERSALLQRLASLLKRYAAQYSLAVVVTNQVMDAINDDRPYDRPAARHTGNLRLITGGREVVPCLGMSWAYCVTLRIFLARTGHLAPPLGLLPGKDGMASAPLVRCMQLVFSPRLAPAYCYYLVEAGGVRGLGGPRPGAGCQLPLPLDLAQEPVTSGWHVDRGMHPGQQGTGQNKRQRIELCQQ